MYASLDVHRVKSISTHIRDMKTPGGESFVVRYIDIVTDAGEMHFSLFAEDPGELVIGSDR